MLGLEKKLALYGFNNLTKTLSFNIYDVCYAKTKREQEDYIQYIDEQYNSERLTKILCDVTKMIGATILNISKQDYEPQGASVNILIAEGHVSPENIDKSCNQGSMPVSYTHLYIIITFFRFVHYKHKRQICVKPAENET